VGWATFGYGDGTFRQTLDPEHGSDVEAVGRRRATEVPNLLVVDTRSYFRRFRGSDTRLKPGRCCGGGEPA
jgi:hypothetical protein